MPQSRLGRRILSIVAMFIVLLDLFAIVVNLFVDPSSMISLLGLFYLVVLVYAYTIVRRRDLVMMYRFMSHRVIGRAVPQDPGYRYLFLGTVIFGVLWVVWFLLSLFGVVLGAGIDIVSVFAFGIAMTGPMAIYYFAREHIQNSQYVNKRMEQSLQPVLTDLKVPGVRGTQEWRDAYDAWTNGDYEEASRRISEILNVHEADLRSGLGDDGYERLVRRFTKGGGA